MCSTTMNTLAALQTAVLPGTKIDFSEKSAITQMESITQQIIQFVQDAENHNSAALDEFKKLEQFLADQRRALATNVSAAKKTAAADERRAEADRRADAKRREKEDAAADRKIVADRKKATKEALLKLNKFMKKPKSPTDGKDVKVLKWAMVGAKTNYATAKKAANKAAREAKKAQKEADAAARKIENAGKPKNGDYARFCKWFKASQEEIAAAGCANKRDYNKEIWADGIELAWGEWTDDEDITWEDFKKSVEAPWNQ